MKRILNNQLTSKLVLVSALTLLAAVLVASAAGRSATVDPRDFFFGGPLADEALRFDPFTLRSSPISESKAKVGNAGTDVLAKALGSPSGALAAVSPAASPSVSNSAQLAPDVYVPSPRIPYRPSLRSPYQPPL